MSKQTPTAALAERLIDMARSAEGGINTEDLTMLLREAASALLAAEQRERALREALTGAEKWLRDWPVTTCHSEHGSDVPIVLMNPANLEAQADKLKAALAAQSEPPATGEPEHEDGCPAITDDESDYEYLADAGECVCRVREWRKQHAHDATREQP